MNLDKSPYNFWKSLPKPVICLAPMEDVTDTAFRELILTINSGPHVHVLFTEFTSTDGLCHTEGRENVSKRLFVSKEERKQLKERGIKLVAQIWGADPENFRRAAKFITEHYAFDGIDINMGCPVRKIVKHGGCSALIKQPSLAKEIILATKEATHLPVSVKTRMGFNTVITEAWISELLETSPAAITLHARTQHMDPGIPADWSQVLKAVELRDAKMSETLILGNGDVMSLEEANRNIQEYKPDGVMIGRGIFANPWLFTDRNVTPGMHERIQTLLLHVNIFSRVWGETKNFNILKRFFKIYLNEFPHASRLRGKLMEARSKEDVTVFIHEFLNSCQAYLPENIYLSKSPGNNSFL